MKFFPKRMRLVHRKFLFYLALSFAILFLPSRVTQFARHAALLPIGFVRRATLLGVDWATALVGRVTHSSPGPEETANLKQRVARLEARLATERSRRMAAEARLAQYTSLPPDLRRHAVLARLTGYSASPLRRTITLNLGTLGGVTRDCPVFWNGVVVGRVISAAPGSCEVALVGDRDCVLAVRSARTRVAGVLHGLGGNLCKVKYVERTADVRAGDGFVTAGLDGVFPPDRYVGTCTLATSETGELHRWVEVKPAVDPSRIETAAILIRGQPATDGVTP